MTDTIASAPTGRSDLVSALRRAGPLAAAALVANGSNLVVTVLIAHLLSSRGYGSLTELYAVFLVLSMPGSALLVAVVRRVTAWPATSGPTAAWVRRLRRRGLIALAGWTAIAVVVRGPLGRQLGLPGPAGVTEVLVAGGGWAILSVERGLLQSRRAYGQLARNLCVEAIVRTVLTVGLVGAGLGVEGAAIAVAASMAAAVVDSRASLAGHGLPAGRRPTADSVVEPMPAPAGVVAGPPVVSRSGLAADLATALAALGLIAILQNIDVLRVGHLAAAAAGPYGAISVASKAVVFGALVLSGYLLPEAAMRSRRGDHALHQLAVALGLVGVPVAGLAAAAVVAPRPLLRIAFGPDKTQAAGALATLALAMGCLAATVLLTHYLLGVGRRRVVGVLAVAAVALVVAVEAAHGRPMATARAELLCQAALTATLAALVATVPRAPRPASS